MSKEEQAAVTAYVKREYDRVVFQQPNSYLSMNAQSDPESWQSRLRELIAGDEKRVATILAAYARAADVGPAGFTLIELALVLVIIGLIVGGVLVGQNLVSAAAVRAQISQIEKYNTAVNTFRDKYGGLPGDLSAVPAAQFGFVARGQYPGEGDGNGTIEGNSSNTSSGNNGFNQLAGETAVFWVDLSAAHMIDGTFTMASETSGAVWVAYITPNDYVCGGCDELANLIPAATIGQNNRVYVWSRNSINYFGLGNVLGVNFSNGYYHAPPALTVQQAYSIDKKIDDGLPMTGRVTAEYVVVGSFWSPPYPYVDPSGTPDYGTTLAGSATSCLDNNNMSGVIDTYSVTQNSSSLNCGISFKFQ